MSRSTSSGSVSAVVNESSNETPGFNSCRGGAPNKSHCIAMERFYLCVTFPSVSVCVPISMR